MLGIFAARCQGCGEITAALVQGCFTEKEEAEELYKWIREGRSVSIVGYPVKLNKCRCKKEGE